jgi:hypothetical protein
MVFMRVRVRAFRVRACACAFRVRVRAFRVRIMRGEKSGKHFARCATLLDSGVCNRQNPYTASLLHT